MNRKTQEISTGDYDCINTGGFFSFIYLHSDGEVYLSGYFSFLTRNIRSIYTERTFSRFPGATIQKYEFPLSL